MLSPSFDFKAPDCLRLAGAGMVVIGKSLCEAVSNLLGVLALLAIGLLKALKIIK
jgi:hypothetical protein